jgi:hypothetical protein
VDFCNAPKIKYRFVYFLPVTDRAAMFEACFICFRMPLVRWQLLLLLVVMIVACSLCTNVRARQTPQYSGQHDDIVMAGDREDKSASGQVVV